MPLDKGKRQFIFGNVRSLDDIVIEPLLDEKDVVVILTEWRATMDNLDYWVVWLQDLCRSWAIEIICV